MKYTLMLIIMFLAFNVRAELPSWVRKDCELHAYDALINHFSESSRYYQIRKIISTEGTAASGQEIITTILKFDYSNGCIDQEVIVDCGPLDPYGDDHTMFVRVLISDCE